MKLPRSPRIQPTGEVKVDNALRIIWEEIARVINGNISFGTFDGGPGGVGAPDNIAGAWFDAVTGPADTDFTVQHNLGRIPQGWLLVLIDKAGIVYQGVTPWTESQIFLRCSTATTHVRLFVI